MRSSRQTLVLVTGATSGIGLETARQLLRQGANVVVHGRSDEKVQSAIDGLRAEANGRLEKVAFDLTDLQAVRRGTAELLRRFPELNVLVANAGVYRARRHVTPDGFEETFAVNHLAHFALTLLLLPALRAGAPSRVVVVSSIAHQSGRMHFDDPMLERGYDGYEAYAQSKLANVLFTRELAHRLEGTGITANALHPGVIDTKLLRAGFGPGGAPVEVGADTPVYLALSPEVEGMSGEYFVRRRPSPVSARAQDEEAQARLWELSERLTGVKWRGA